MEQSKFLSNNLNNNEMHRNKSYKVVFVGDSTVGKTSIIQNYITKKLDETILSTIGATSIKISMEISNPEQENFVDSSLDSSFDEESTSFSSSSLKKLISPNVKVDLNVWDTGGQENFRNIVPLYARGAKCAIIVFDRTNKETLQNVYEWHNLMRNRVGDDLVFIVVQNKIDLKSSVDLQDLYLWAEKNKVILLETSAKNGCGIETLFDTIARTLYNKETEINNDFPIQQIKQKNENIIQLNNPKKVTKKASCC